jgi:hypothetical protein
VGIPITSYLVRLGFSEDTASYGRFAHSLRGASSLVSGEYLEMGKKVVEFQAAAVGAFAAIGLTVIGMAEKTAKADQEYRLLALHMFTTKNVAREFKVALDALGQPLENVMWDPELAARFNKLVEDQRRVVTGLGGTFDANMVKIRDVSFEFTRLGTFIETGLIPMIVNDLANLFGTDADGLLAKLQAFNEWFMTNMPEIAATISADLKPVLDDVVVVMESLWDFTKQVLITFTDLIGLISGDDSIRTSTLDFQKLAQAVGWVVDGFTVAVTALFQLGTNLTLLVGAAAKAVAGDYTGAMANIIAMKPILSVAEGIAQKRADVIIAGRGGVGPANPWETPKEQIARVATKLGVPVELALAVAQVESGTQQYDKTGKPIVNRGKSGESHATGMFQLEPGTAREMGVDPNTMSGNILGGIGYLAKKLKQAGGSESGALERYYGGSKKDSAEYAAKVMHVESGIQIASLTINVPPGMGAEAAQKAVTKGIADAAKLKAQREIAEHATPGYSYG